MLRVYEAKSVIKTYDKNKGGVELMSDFENKTNEEVVEPKSVEALERRLFKVYRQGMYAFGVVMATGIIAGTWLGLQKVRSHDDAHRLQVNSPIERAERAVNPYKDAQTVEFTLPYMHGTNPETLRYMAQLSASKTESLPKQGFVVEGVYRSGNLEHTTLVKLACEGPLCEMKFKLPARYVLPPRMDGRKIVTPKRNFEVYSNGYVLEVKDSKLGGMAPVDDKSLALFNQRENLKPFYREAYFDSQGKWIRPNS